MYTLKLRWYVVIAFILFTVFGWCVFEIIHEIKEGNRLASLPDKRNELPYYNPIKDTDLMNVGRAGYLMGIARKGDDRWGEDSLLLRAVILKPIKPNTDDYSKTN